MREISNEKKIIVASKNPVKINAVRGAFQKMFPMETFEVEGIFAMSAVSKQPSTEEETLLGAFNRADNVSQENPAADYWVGIEGGIKERDSEMEAFAWVVIKSMQNGYGKGRTGTFFLPLKIAELIRGGRELGEADDMVFGRDNSKQENGAVGILTGNVIDRTNYYRDAVVLALIPFKNEGLYSMKEAL